MTFQDKKKLLKKHLLILQDKIDVFQEMIAELTENGNTDQKSSAGDKHETTLSKLHLEQEKLTQNLLKFIESKKKLSKLDANLPTTSELIVLGSLVKTNRFWIFIADALPKISIQNIEVYSVSNVSPLGKELLGKKNGEEIFVNNVLYKVEQIV